MSFWDEWSRLTGLQSLHPAAPRSAMIGGIIPGTLYRIVCVAIVGFWTQDAFVLTNPRRLYAGLLFWILYKIPQTVHDAIEVANRMIPRCDCGETHAGEHTAMRSYMPDGGYKRSPINDVVQENFRVAIHENGFGIERLTPDGWVSITRPGFSYPTREDAQRVLEESVPDR